MNGWKCFLDMDGVLADFVGACCKAHGKTCYDKPEHYGNFDMEKIWGMSVNEFWGPTNSYEFWRNLEKTPEADAIVDLAFSKFGKKNVAILTSPSLNPYCVPAKRDWIKEHYPSLAKTMIFAWGKGFIGGPNKVLIDDRDRNIDDWENAGGIGILVSRLWNKLYPVANSTMGIITDDLDYIGRQNATNGS